MRRILVVDDDPDVRARVRRQLDHAGYEVIDAEDAKSAAAALAEGAADLIIADINMPKMSGDAFVATLRAEERTAQIPVIYLTALEEDHELVVKTLGYPVLAKALMARDLIPMVKRQLRR
ncbi:MAG TPA: response regulator [Burkholderiales bacterium]